MAAAKKESPFSAFGIIGILIVCYYGFNQVDKWDPDSHDAESTITAQANWILGESKYCTSLPEAATDKHEAGYAFEFANCDEGPSHLVKITFWGREEQPEYVQVNWKCVRNADQLTCADQGGVRNSRSSL